MIDGTFRITDNPKAASAYANLKQNLKEDSDHSFSPQMSMKSYEVADSLNKY